MTLYHANDLFPGYYILKAYSVYNIKKWALWPSWSYDQRRPYVMIIFNGLI